MHDLIVLKFGGASVASPLDFDKVALIIQKKQKEGKGIVVVVSAMAKTTDQLIAMAHEVNPQPPKRELDMLVSVGERISIALLAMALQKIGVSAVSLTGSQSGIITSNDHTEAKIQDIRPKRVLEFLKQGNVVIVAGFQGMSLQGEITTLGRGGSDTSAVGLAIALGAKEVEFYKEVQGIFDKDPLKHQDACFLPKLNYDEMINLCDKGAKVLHKRSVELAKKNLIVLCVRSFKDTNLECSYIQGNNLDAFSKKALFEESI